MMDNKKCIVIRHGALGDSIMASCALPLIAEEGYKIHYYTNDKGKLVLKANPYIKEFILHNDSIPIGEELEQEWNRVSEGYDKVVNFTGSMENELLFAHPQPMYFKSLEERRKYVNGRNYFDHHLEMAGYKPRPILPDLHLSKREKKKGFGWRKKLKDHFIIIWCLAGSAHHKIYRYYEQVAREFLNKHGNAYIITVGDYPTKLLTFEHPRVTNTMFAELPFRDTIILTKYADLVIGPETGTVICAAAFKTPVIVMLSHSGEAQLTKYWHNCYSIKPPCSCSPCHLLHKYKEIWKETCELGDLGFARCTEHDPEIILEKMEEEYAKV